MFPGLENLSQFKVGASAEYPAKPQGIHSTCCPGTATGRDSSHSGRYMSKPQPWGPKVLDVFVCMTGPEDDHSLTLSTISPLNCF